MIECGKKCTLPDDAELMDVQKIRSGQDLVCFF